MVVSLLSFEQQFIRFDNHIIGRIDGI